MYVHDLGVSVYASISCLERPVQRLACSRRSFSAQLSLNLAGLEGSGGLGLGRGCGDG